MDTTDALLDRLAHEVHINGNLVSSGLSGVFFVNSLGLYFELMYNFIYL